MQNFRDYYQILGVAQTATADELKSAYRQAARRYHPDLNPDDDTAEEKFKEVGEAYDVLSDSDRRNEYDQLTQFLNQKKTGLFSSLKKEGNDYSRFTDFNVFVEYLLNRRGIANVQEKAEKKAKGSSPSVTGGVQQKAEEKVKPTPTPFPKENQPAQNSAPVTPGSPATTSA
ncbi:MAG: DnaJ domain-containing protein, partial [Merismopedia sp. SIO2A8]|nr:DnaJ domain-containing protein [Merismopedia sp. SIO2A8]